MCEGGVAIWSRSAAVRPSASRQCRTAARSEAWVCRTAFGIPVVPELKTSTASAAGVRLRLRWLVVRRDRLVQVQHRHQPGQHRMVADGVRPAR